MAGPDFFSGKPFPNVLLVDLLNAAAVFLINAELAVTHLQRGFELQEIRAQSREVGAAAALGHISQRIQYEAGLHLSGEGAQMLRDLRGAHAAVAALRPLDGQQAHAC